MSEYTLGLDFGGGGGRALLLDIASGESTVAAQAWSFPLAPNTGGLGTDVDLAHAWGVLTRLTHEVLARAAARPEQVVGIAATAMRLGNVIVDASGTPILAVPNRDARAAGPGILLAVHHGEALQKTMGRWPYPIHTAARLQWLMQNRPDDAARADTVFSLSDWIGMRLCGERASDPTQAAETLLFELESRAWSEDWPTKLGLSAALLPRILEAGSSLGELNADAAEALGLRPGTPVAMGGADTQCAALGAGGIRTGTAAVVAGTTAPVQVSTDRPIIDPDVRVWGSQHLVPGRWVVESNPGPAGEVLEWMSAVLFADAPEPVAALLEAAEASEIGAFGFLSSLGAEVMNDRAMGLPIGNLTISHLSTGGEARPGHAVARAVIEGIACGLTANLKQVEHLTGDSDGPMILAGGLSRSRFFAELLAGIAQRPIRRSRTPDTSAIGAALCAAVAIGRFDSLDEAADSRTLHAETVEPIDRDREAYKTLQERWTAWRAASSDLDTANIGLTMPYALAGLSRRAQAE